MGSSFPRDLAAIFQLPGRPGGDGFSIAGNMLCGAAVLNDTANADVANARLPFAQRLIAAMLAGEAAGGDKRENSRRRS